jgi:regulator of replication initiation timing
MTSDLQTENERLRLEISNLKKLVTRLYNNITKARAHRVVESAVLDSQNGVSLLSTQGAQHEGNEYELW